MRSSRIVRSPDQRNLELLNLIERLWKFVKKHCLYSKYYEKFEPFKQAISDCLALTSTKYKNELKSLLTLNFQTFEKAQIVTM